jgi:hypothetical protein
LLSTGVILHLIEMKDPLGTAVIKVIYPHHQTGIPILGIESQGLGPQPLNIKIRDYTKVINLPTIEQMQIPRSPIRAALIITGDPNQGALQRTSGIPRFQICPQAPQLFNKTSRCLPRWLSMAQIPKN